MNPTVRSTFATGLLVIAIQLLIRIEAEAVPITYSFDDTGFGDPTIGAGVGTFTIDVPGAWTDPISHPEIQIHATQLTGGPGRSIGRWTDLVLDVNPVQGGLLFQGGGRFLMFVGSAADVGKTDWATPTEAWTDLRAYWDTLGVGITPLAPVPDLSETALSLAVALGFLGLTRHLVIQGRPSADTRRKEHVRAGVAE